MPATDQWRTENDNFPGEDAVHQSPAPKTDTSTDPRRHKIGDDWTGKGVNLKSIQEDIIEKKKLDREKDLDTLISNPQNCNFEPDPNLKSIQEDLIEKKKLDREKDLDTLIFNPQNYNFESDPNIVWLQNPMDTFKGTQAVQFSQVQSIIRERLRELRPDFNYAVVRAGPHHRQNKHDRLGNVIRKTSRRTGRPYNATNPADLHITLHAGKKGEKGEENSTCKVIYTLRNDSTQTRAVATSTMSTWQTLR
ncbi:hypothetical protein N0V85_006000 [Neurospora sp. IMI 360204]|nr:hypothetical protein N0V85_006000 [Neurospora sp. IMI 360204]